MNRPYRRRIAAAIALLSIALVLAWIGAAPIPLSSDHGTALNRPNSTLASTVAGKATLRLATFNIHSGFGADGRWDLKRTASVLRNFDIIGLNEVRGFPLGYGNMHTLGEALEMPWLFAPTEQRWWFDEFGNGVLCRLPIESWRRTPLVGGARGFGFRNVLQLAVRWNGKILNLLVTHLDTRHDRVQQLRTLGEMFASSPSPAVLMGDLNTFGGDSTLQAILNASGAVDAIGAKLGQPTSERIDWILTRGLQTVAAGIEDRGASDHPLVWAELRFP
jgi:endonuclease/exonuclease/phosphatase family metal-dependent hydrolase